MAAKPLEKSSQLENASWIPKKLKDLTKNPQCFGGYKPQFPYTKNSLGISRGLWDSEQHELSLKNLPESHKFCVFGIHIEH